MFDRSILAISQDAPTQLCVGAGGAAPAEVDEAAKVCKAPAGAAGADVYAAPAGAAGAAAPEPSGWRGEGRVISLGSFTKILAPGLRLGWAEASPALVAKLASRGYLVSGGAVAPFASEVVSELLVSGAQRAILEELRLDYAKSARALTAALRQAGCFELLTEPSGGMFAFCTLPEGVRAADLARAKSNFGKFYSTLLRVVL